METKRKSKEKKNSEKVCGERYR